MDSLKKLEKNDMKYIFFDIDGTLTDNTTGKIVPSAQEALDKLQENGNFVSKKCTIGSAKSIGCY